MSVHNSENGDDYVEDIVTLIIKLDIGDPLHLHPNDTTALTVVLIKLKGTKNYQVWSCAMLLALEWKNKTGFIDGTCKRSNTDEVLGKQWDRKQYDAMTQLPKCVCNASQGFKKYNQLLKLMQFLIGEESHRVIAGSIAGFSQRNKASAFVSNVPNRCNFQRNNHNTSNGFSRPNNITNNRQDGGSALICENYGFNGHTIDRCFKIIGYPADFEKKKSATLISLIKDNKIGKNVQANMAELDNVLDISHLKIEMGHPYGTKAFIYKIGNLKLSNSLTLYDVMDLNLKNVLGIGDQCEGLYYYNDQDFVMSDSEDSTVTYTEVSSPFEDLSDIGSPGVHGLPMMPEDPYAYVEAALQAPPSPDYVPGPEEPEQAPPLPDFVPEPVYPEFMPPEDDKDPEEDDEDPEEDPADYPTDRDDDDEEEEDSFGDDADDEGEDEDKDEEEEEHLAPADSVPPPACRTTARMSILEQIPIPFPSTAEVDRFLAISTPPPAPLTSYSSPLPQIPSPPLPVSSPLLVSPPPLPVSPTYHLGYRAAMIRLRAESPSTSYPLPLPSSILLPHTRASMVMMKAAAPSTYIFVSRSETLPSGTPPLLPIPLPTPSPPLLLPSIDCKAGVFEVTLPPRKRLCITLGLRFKVGESSSAPTTRPTGEFRRDYGFVATLDDEIRRDPERDVGYGITDTWDEMVEDMQGTPTAIDVAGLSQRMTDFVMTVRQYTDEIYGRLDDAQDDRSLMSGQLNLLRRDRRAHARTTRLMESEARLSREAWQTKIGDSRAADLRRQTQLTEALTLLRTLQTQMATLHSQQTPARDPSYLDVSEEAGSSS
ncbi:putative reverse transcriptase domain-containing protein [Tanacetum coccineum]